MTKVCVSQKRSPVRGGKFDNEVFSCIPNMPDIVVVGKAGGRCIFWMWVALLTPTWSRPFVAKLLKYHLHVSRLNTLSYQCKLVVLIFGTKAKQLARYCSMSAVKGSLAV